MAVFADIQKCVAPIDKSHFVQMIDKGKAPVIKSIVITLLFRQNRRIQVYCNGDCISFTNRYS